MKKVNQAGFCSVAFPIIGAGTGGFGESGALAIMQEAFAEVESEARIVIVKYKRR